ncbi:MAG: alpha/beta fold hydrolase [Oscillospiraceae bacterium]|nr:alpha/beta fold hydrolase [Oscillospiraceae bacterium]
MAEKVKKSAGKRAVKIVVIVLCVLVILFSVVSFFATKSVFNDMFGRADIPEYTAFIRYDDVSDKYDREEVSFKSGENTLKGHIYGNENNEKGLVVISHGLGGYSESYFGEIRYFVDNGYKVIAYDNTGSGNSEGEGTTGMAQSAIDLDSALTFAESDERLNSLPFFLYGHSWGGYAVTAVLDNGHDITAVASVAGYNSPMGIIYEFGQDMLGKPFAFIEYPFMWLNNKLLFGSEANVSAVDSINSTDTAVLIIHGTGDETILYDGASIIAQKENITNPNVEYRTIEGVTNGHNSLFYTENAYNYQQELNKVYDELEEKYNGEIPDDAEQEFRNSVDKNKTSELSDEVTKNVDEFYMNALKNQGGKS